MSTTATLIGNELRNTLSLSQDIVLLRLRKMANRAVDSLEGGKVDVRTLTPKEKDMYAELARFMAISYDQLVPPKASAAVPAVPATAPATSPPEEVPPKEDTEEGEGQAPGDVAPEEVEGPGPKAVPEGAVLIHVLKDTPPFAGEDGQTYSLKKGDMVSLPEKLAQVLISRNMAEQVSGS